MKMIEIAITVFVGFWLLALAGYIFASIVAFLGGPYRLPFSGRKIAVRIGFVLGFCLRPLYRLVKA